MLMKSTLTHDRQKIKKQSFLEDKDVKDTDTKELEIKQVEFKLGEDCWDIKYQSTSGCQSTAA